MLLNELNLKALNVSAESVLPVEKVVNVEGKEVIFKITAFKSGFGTGKKTVVSGSAKRTDNGTTCVFDLLDIEKLRRALAKLCELTTSGRISERKPRAPKESTEVEKLRQSLAVARRLCSSHTWVELDTKKLRASFFAARLIDRKNKEEALKARAVAPILERVAKLSAEERALLLASLQ